MSYTAEYTRPYVGGWQNTPSKETPVMAENLNNYDTAIISIESYLSEKINNDFAQLSEAGYSLGLEIDHSTYVMTISLKNKAGKVISDKSIDFPIESMIIHAEYNESTKFITMTLQNGQTLDVNISAIVSGLVPDTRTIAGFELKNDITSEELKNALAVPSKVSELDNDLGYITSEDVKSDDSVVAIGEIKNWLYDTSGEEVIVGVYGGKPLYRKVLKNLIATSTTNNDISFEHGIENVETIRVNPTMSYIEGIPFDGTVATYPVNYVSVDGNEYSWSAVADNTYVTLRAGTDRSSLISGITFTLEYTKTTDAEGSGNRLTPYGFVRKDFANTSENDIQKSYYGGLSIEKICGAVEQNGVPTIDSPVEIQNVDIAEIKSNGKQLIPYPYYHSFPRVNRGITFDNYDGKGGIIANGTSDTANQPYFMCEFSRGVLKANQPYTFAGNCVDENGFAVIFFKSSDGAGNVVNISYTEIRNGVTSTVTAQNISELKNGVKTNGVTFIPSEDVCIQFDVRFVGKGETVNNAIFHPQLEVGTELTEYEPYKSSTAKVAFTGRAVEVSESDAYTYEKDGKYYVADTIEKTDSGYQLVQRVLHLVFDGTEEWSRSVNADGITYRMLFNDSDIPSYTDLGVRTWSKVLMCSHMQQCLSSSTQPYSGGETIAIHNSNHMIQLYSAKYQDLDSWKAFLVEQYANGTPFTVDIRLAEPIITELSDADKIQLLSLKTFEEVTHLSTDSVIKPIITSEYGISKTGGYTLESLQTAKRNDLRINALENLAIE